MLTVINDFWTDTVTFYEVVNESDGLGGSTEKDVPRISDEPCRLIEYTYEELAVLEKKSIEVTHHVTMAGANDVKTDYVAVFNGDTGRRYEVIEVQKRISPDRRIWFLDIMLWFRKQE